MQSYVNVSETIIFITSKKENQKRVMEIWDFLKQDDKILILKLENPKNKFLSIGTKS